MKEYDPSERQAVEGRTSDECKDQDADLRHVAGQSDRELDLSMLLAMAFNAKQSQAYHQFETVCLTVALLSYLYAVDLRRSVRLWLGHDGLRELRMQCCR